MGFPALFVSLQICEIDLKRITGLASVLVLLTVLRFSVLRHFRATAQAHSARLGLDFGVKPKARLGC